VYSDSYFWLILIKSAVLRIPIIEFHEYSSCGCRVVACGWMDVCTDRQEED
jgi:hypothetical protein